MTLFDRILAANNIFPGTHITAVGADAPGKQELDPKIFEIADLIIVDSIEQCRQYGETSHIHNNMLLHNKIHELGTALQENNLHRTHNSQITVADLTGVAVQDLQIAKSILM